MVLLHSEVVSAVNNLYEDYQDLDLVAAEYAIGLLSPEERLAAEHELNNNATFRVLVELWEERLQPLSNSYGATKAPNVWPQLQKELFPHSQLFDLSIKMFEHALFVPAVVCLKFSLILMILSLAIRR